MMLYMVQNEESCLWYCSWSKTRRVVYDVVHGPKRGELFMMLYMVQD